MTVFFAQAIVTTLLTIVLFKKVFQECAEYKRCHRKQQEASDFEKKGLINETKSQTIPVIYVLQQIWPQLLSVFITFFICLSLFPACLTDIRQGPRDAFDIKTKDWGFINYATFLVFNIGDWLGKKSARWRYAANKEWLTLSLCFGRFVFYYLFYLCNPSGTRDYNDGWMFLVVNALFSVTSGYFGSLCMAHASEVFAEKSKSLYNEDEINEAQSRVGPYMVIALVFGLLVGASFSNITSRALVVLIQQEQFDHQVKIIAPIVTRLSLT